MNYYLDTNIWLNLFKMEKCYWRIAYEFIENVEKSENKIIVSSIVLKELKYKLDTKFERVKNFFTNSKYIKVIKTKNEDYDFARKLEDLTEFKIGFLDYLHIAICKRMEFDLITRDYAMLLNNISKHIAQKI